MYIKYSIQPEITDLGEFSVRRLLPNSKQPMVGPWIFFDHMGPATFDPGLGLNVRPHPHIHLATVTYLFEGEILHRDSLGNEQLIHPGDINLMIAGKGIVHSERETEIRKAQSRTIHGLQLWMALPDKAQDIEPEFLHYAAEEIPQTKISHVAVRVLIGEAYGLVSPVKTFCQTGYFEAFLEAEQELPLEGIYQQQAIYIAAGEVEIGDAIKGASVCKEHTLIILDDHAKVSIKALQKAQIAVISGETIGKRYMEWNFVSNDKANIKQAKNDWRAGRFPLVPGDEEEFIPLP